MAWEKIGECNQCGLCCLIAHVAIEAKQHQDRDHLLDKIRDGYKIARKTKKFIYLVKWDPCPYLSMDLKCTLHNKALQPHVCRVFPTFPEGFYQVVKKRCSIKFKRVSKAEGVKLKEQGREVYP